ncbi:MAG: hypothetical protein J6Y78_12045 [Paludibacteraceae bacterium]|nr:hypothetical protein [Paludibacteraceae bacterium]
MIMEEDKKLNSTEKKGSVIIALYQKLTNGEKNCLKAYIIWLFVHCALLASGKNNNGFFPWSGSWKLRWHIYDYGLPEFIVYVALIPTMYTLFILFTKKQNQIKLL